MGEQETVIYEVLRKAQADGTLSQTQDARALARFFLGVAVGIKAVNKSVADPGVFQGYGQSRDDRLEHAGRSSAQNHERDHDGCDPSRPGAIARAGESARTILKAARKRDGSKPAH